MFDAGGRLYTRGTIGCFPRAKDHSLVTKDHRPVTITYVSRVRSRGYGAVTAQVPSSIWGALLFDSNTSTTPLVRGEAWSEAASGGSSSVSE